MLVWILEDLPWCAVLTGSVGGRIECKDMHNFINSKL